MSHSLLVALAQTAQEAQGVDIMTQSQPTAVSRDLSMGGCKM
jgi:hypothetical protein